MSTNNQDIIATTQSMINDLSAKKLVSAFMIIKKTQMMLQMLVHYVLVKNAQVKITE